MDLKLTFLGRVANRWRVRVEVPPALRVRGLTVGLWGEDGRPLGPAVVAPAFVGEFNAEIAGPDPLPPGAQVRCIADVQDIHPIESTIGIDRRCGLHAFLHADCKLEVGPTPRGAAVNSHEMRRLTRVFPWLACAPRPAEGDDLRSMLKDLGIDDDLIDPLED